MSLIVNEKYITVPTVTTTERNALTAANGMLVYDNTLNRFYKYENGAWSSFTAGSAAWGGITGTLSSQTDLQNALNNRPVLISTATASTSATIDFTLPSGYKLFEIRCISVVPSTDNVGMWIRVSTDGGSTFLSGASDYAYQRSILSGTTYSGTLTATDSKIAIVDAGIGTGTGRYCNTTITMFEPSIASMYKNIVAKQYVYRSDGAYNIREVNGVYLSNTAVNAIRILMSSGNIASGTFELWGYK